MNIYSNKFGVLIIIIFNCCNLTFVYAQVENSCANSESIVTFLDWHLENAVSATLGKTSLSCLDLQNLTELSAQNTEIRSLKGLEFAINLTDLRLNNNEITDLSPIANLVQLKRLWLNNNQLTDNSMISLEKLTSLEDLRLGDNLIENDFALLSLLNLKNLSSLQINNNHFEDLQNLVFLSSITNLNIGGNPLTKKALEVLRFMPNLKVINLSSLGLEDSDFIVSLFRKPEEIQGLVLNFNRIVNIEPLTALSNLDQLHLSGSPISDFLPLSQLTSLRIVNLSQTGFEEDDYVIFNSLSKLQWLALNRNNLTNISSLANSPLQKGAKLLLEDNCIPNSNSAIQSLIKQGVDVQMSWSELCGQ